MKTFETFLEESSTPSGHTKVEFNSHKAWKAAAKEHGFDVSSSGKHALLHSRASKSDEKGLGIQDHGMFKPERANGKIKDSGKGHLFVKKS